MHPHTFLIRNVLRKWYQNQGSTVFTLTSQTTEITKSACEPKMTRAPCRRRTGEALPRAEKFGDLIMADHKVHVKQQLFRKHKRAYKSSWSRRGNQKLFALTNPQNLAKPVKIFLGIIVRRHHTDQKQMRLLTEQCAEWKKAPLQYCRNQVWMKIGGQILWSAHCNLRNIQDLLSDGKTPYERRFGKPFKGPIIPYGSLVEYYPISAKDQSRIHQFGKKVLPGLFLGYALYAGGIWKCDILVADIEELETMDASEIYSKRRNAKEVRFPKEKENLFFQSQMDESNPLEEIRNWENTHLGTGTPNSRRKSKGFSTRIRGVSSSDRINRWRWSPCRLLVDSRWLHLSSSQWTSSSTLCAEGRNIPYPTEMHWYNQVYLHWSGRHARETCRWLLESIRTEACQIRGKVSQNSLYLKKTSPGKNVVRVENDKSSNDYQTRSRVARSMDENW